jgi:hypothetical protein
MRIIGMATLSTDLSYHAVPFTTLPVLEKTLFFTANEKNYFRLIATPYFQKHPAK